MGVVENSHAELGTQTRGWPGGAPVDDFSPPAVPALGSGGEGALLDDSTSQFPCPLCGELGE